MIEEILILGMMLSGLLAGFILGMIIMGRWIQKELLGHGNWSYSPRQLVDEVKSKMIKH